MKHILPLLLSAILLTSLPAFGQSRVRTNAEKQKLSLRAGDSSASQYDYTPVFPQHEPYGTGVGAIPGRVVWSYDPASIEWDGSGYWWELSHFDETAIQSMVRSGIASLAGEQDAVSGWDSLFRAHNTAHGGSGGYQSGQKIAVKANMNGFGTFGDDSPSHMSYTNPMVLKTLLVSLVTDAGVAPQNITVYDASRLFPQEMMSICTQGELSGVQFRYMDLGGPNDAQPDTSTPVVWSQSVSGADNYLPTCVAEADYLINLAELKGHSYGITLTGKNHFGSLMNSSRLRPPEAAGIHRYLTQNRMDAYTVLVDLMGNYQLGEKTMLYMLDAIICAVSEGSSVSGENSRWQQEPFNGDYTSSLFFSQDPVAIDSVGADFLMNEPAVTSRNSVLRDNPTVENYLHEAGLVANAPSGTAYYNGNGERITNLGVHEHWNNPIDKQYSRNLGADRGIELIQTGPSASNPDHTESPVTRTIFRDVPAGAWYADAVTYCRQQGLMSGVSADIFAPAETVSRGMLAAILYRQAGSPATQISAVFPDIPANIWYSNAAAWAAQNGMISGYADGRFGPNDPVTRAQIAAILWRHAGTPQSDTAEQFSDHSEISAYALDAANWARDTGIISGDSANRFRPKSAASRAELAVVLYRYLSHEMG